VSESRDLAYVEHMLEALDRIDQYVSVGRDEFMLSSLVQDAVVRNLQTMTESSQRLSDEIKQRHAEIDWRAMAGFRNILTHDYLGIDLDLIWITIEKELPALKRVLLEEKLK
jgi:uncharacterized protein with HEPN domain